MATFEEKWEQFKAELQTHVPDWQTKFLDWANERGLHYHGSGFFNEFPHTHTYETDLSWLISRMKWVLFRQDSVEERMALVERMLIEFVDTLDIDQLIKDALEEMIRNGDLNQIIYNYLDQIVRPFIGAFGEMTKTYESALEFSNFSGRPSELTGLSSGVWELYENDVLAYIKATGKFTPTQITGFTFTNSRFFNVRLSNSPQDIEVLKRVPVKDPNGVSNIFQRQMGYAELRNGYWTNNNFTADKPCISNLTLTAPSWLAQNQKYLLNGGNNIYVGGANGSITFETYYVKDTPAN